MWTAECVVAELRNRGELWDVAPGVAGLRGAPLLLFQRLEALIADHARAHGAHEWQAPCVVGLDTLARAEYFSCFPQWLTVASHLSDDTQRLEQLARAADPAAEVCSALAPCAVALPPATCYSVYAAFANTSVPDDARVTVQGTCWRHESERMTPLERPWTFTMREIVRLGAEPDIELFRLREIERAQVLARTLGLTATVEQASDPFFKPTARGKDVLQKIKALKHELRLPVAPHRTVAAASFNNHERFFGEAFGISRLDGTPAFTACAAFGIERWLLAFLVAHGPDAANWPLLSGNTANVATGSATESLTVTFEEV
jgi:seryl-tRNA synthetase